MPPDIIRYQGHSVRSSQNQITKPRYFTQSPIASIIPAYNEAGRIHKVLAVLTEVPLIDEIIVVDDGSRDGTVDEVHRMAEQDQRIRVISHPSNRGKGGAIFTGWQSTKARYLLFLDADLLALKPHHVIGLLNPVINNQVDMTVGLFCKGHFRTDLAHKLTPWLTGQRAIYSDLLRYTPFRAAAGYGIETALTIAARKYHWRCQNVPLVGVYHAPSECHRGLWHGIMTRLRMYGQIARAWYLAEASNWINAHFGIEQ
jgi:glycosyltransferase involved in cell wall biosynthesis